MNESRRSSSTSTLCVLSMYTARWQSCSTRLAQSAHNNNGGTHEICAGILQKVNCSEKNVLCKMFHSEMVDIHV
jgi:hypothetical protein